MFSYYGSKSKIAKFYPKPKFNMIIEPFAGSAAYSLLYNDKDVILNEKYDKIYNIWKWLIEDADVEELLKNREFYVNQDISKLKLRQEHKDLIGFCINRGSVSPRNIVQKWSCQVKKNPNFASTPFYRLTEIANQIKNIKHWKIESKDYKQIENIEATWFIDPPYQNGGEHYIENNIDYKELADWCLSRKGQVIVCENDKANWLNFTPLVKITGQRQKTIEVIYTN